MRVSLNFLLSAVFFVFFSSSTLRQMLRALNVTLPYAQTQFNLLFVVNGPKCFSPCASTVLVHWLLIASGVNFLGLSFIFWQFSHPVLLIQVENGPKGKKTQKTPTKGGWYMWAHLLCLSGWEKIFIPLRIFDPIRYIFTLFTPFSFRAQTFLHLLSFHPRRPNKSQRVLFSSEAHQHHRVRPYGEKAL